MEEVCDIVDGFRAQPVVGRPRVDKSHLVTAFDSRMVQIVKMDSVDAILSFPFGVGVYPDNFRQP